jgi:hypothetical protein
MTAAWPWHAAQGAGLQIFALDGRNTTVRGPLVSRSTWRVCSRSTAFGCTIGSASVTGVSKGCSLIKPAQSPPFAEEVVDTRWTTCNGSVGTEGTSPGNRARSPLPTQGNLQREGFPTRHYLAASDNAFRSHRERLSTMRLPGPYEALAKAATLSIIGVYPQTARSFPVGKRIGSRSNSNL